MKQFISKRCLQYILFAVIASIWFLYYTFPAEEFANHLENIADRSGLGYTLTIDRVKPSFPATILLTGCRVLEKNREGNDVFEAEEIRLTPKIWSIINGTKRFVFDCRAYNGRIHGSMLFKEKIPGPFDSEIELEAIDLGVYQGLLKEVSYRLAGILNGNITYNGRSGSATGASGKAVMKLTDSRIQLSQPFFDAGSMNLKDITLEMTLNQEKMTTEIEMLAGDLQGRLSGTVVLRKDLLQSSLTLRGMIEPTDEFLRENPGLRDSLQLISSRRASNRGGKQFNLTVSGTLRELRYTLT